MLALANYSSLGTQGLVARLRRQVQHWFARVVCGCVVTQLRLRSSGAKQAAASAIKVSYVKCVSALVAAALALGGCIESQYAREGIGSDLYWPGAQTAAQLQDVYLEYLCRQALPTITAGAVSQCDSSAPVEPALWYLIVQAGMNDIDQRCDAYLTWIDERKRTAGPILQEISDIQTATTAIMTATGVGVTPIAIIAAAFGLGTKTFTNINNTLISTADKSTIQAVVLGRRSDYRTGVNGKTIDNRPAAVHALRDYLNLCLPYTIETDINLTVSSYQKGGVAAVDARTKPNTNTLVSTRTIATAGTIIHDVNRPLPEFPKAPPPNPTGSDPRFNGVERALRVPALQTACGLEPTGILGVLGSPTRLKLTVYLNSIQTDRPARRQNKKEPVDTFDNKDQDDLNALLDDKTSPKCK
jgi:hypothetical protein